MEDTRARWDRAFQEAVDYDTWGQVEEALEGYQRLQVAAAAEYVENVLQLPMVRRDGIGKLAAALKHRIEELSKSTKKGVELAGMKTLKGYMKEIIITDAAFPLIGVKPEGTITAGPVVAFGAPAEVHADPEEEEATIENLDGTAGLRRAPTHQKGDVSLVIYIDKWGIKDAMTFYEPRVIVSVHDDTGKIVEPAQETPVGKANASHVFFENTVYIQTPLNSLTERSAIFFEFGHFKAKENKKSIKAYAFLEMDEIKNGPATLEIYKKPANYKRAKPPALYSVKPLYLHVDLQIQPRK
ncbi:Axin interactor, dorsalization-associated protein [Tetrabaena socialis]|uniref:Axin interactor, dorsalization-associated protein n=1 Tax=Tetrabaena socialis TaxID=47790 RepID=A0A2J8ABM8_9CHLO|nr:Axin interactor, dorsalization-associated protein [Tetrabaena socialis]|eukprot:PNH09929.1 Axin interactor, dorsalization-associated protein [Tetrabaena socialis]